MPNPFESRRIPPVIRETTVAPAEEPVEEVMEEPEEEIEETGAAIDPAKVLYTTDRCSTCEYFIEDGQPCKMVKGSISSDGWCTLHTASSGDEGDEEVEV